MKRVVIRGWKDGVDVHPIRLLESLCTALQVDLAHGKKLLDDFAENGRLTLELNDDVAERLQTIAAKVQIELE